MLLVLFLNILVLHVICVLSFLFTLLFHFTFVLLVICVVFFLFTLLFHFTFVFILFLYALDHNRILIDYLFLKRDCFPPKNGGGEKNWQLAVY